MIQLFNEECLAGMARLEDQSIDMILADPPFGTTTCKWDSVIPLDQMWSQLKRVIRPRGAIVLFGVEPFSSKLRFSNLDQWKYDWIWHKSRPFGFHNAKLRPMTKHEIISVFSDGKTANCNQNNMPYFPQGLVHSPRMVRGLHDSEADREGHRMARPSNKERYLREFTNYPTTVLSFASEAKPVHPTQKPVALMEYLVATYTQPGQMVLDFCFGSGTVAVACQNLGRDFVGFETEQKYFEVASGRIQASSPYPN